MSKSGDTHLCWAALALSVALLACSGGSGPVAPQPPVAIAITSGNNQEGNANEELADPLVVRVMDAQGNGVASVAVSWSVTSGEGALPSSTVTNADGFTQVRLIPTRLGTSTVTASVIGLQGSPVTFTAEATAQTIVLFQSLSPFIPIRPTDVTVPVGTRVEWLSSGPYSIRSISTPPGGESFASGDLNSSERFQFVPRCGRNVGILRARDVRHRG
jgi:predicted component of type VI protein secretion system